MGVSAFFSKNKIVREELLKRVADVTASRFRTARKAMNAVKPADTQPCKVAETFVEFGGIFSTI